MDDVNFLQGLALSGLAQCKVVVVENRGLLLSLFMAGLLGGVTHCVGMCGPFVLSQVTARLENIPTQGMRELHRLSGAALLPYHLGRTTSYAALGAMSAFIAQGALVAFAGLKWLSAALLALAALFFLVYGLKILAPIMGSVRASSVESSGARFIGSRVKPLFGNPSGWRGYGLGVALGFLPCGLLYGALAAAASSGDPLAGVFAMIFFSLGTLPSLFSVGMAGHLAGRQWRGLMSKVAPVLLVGNAGFLSYMAWRLIA